MDIVLEHAALLATARDACESILALSETSETHYTCGEFVAIEELFRAVYDADPHAIQSIRAWHASGDNEPDDCSHAWYLAIMASDGEPIDAVPEPTESLTGSPRHLRGVPGTDLGTRYQEDQTMTKCYDIDPAPIVVVVREPDASNVHHTFGGEVESYDIDLGYMAVYDDPRSSCSGRQATRSTS